MENHLPPGEGTAGKHLISESARLGNVTDLIGNVPGNPVYPIGGLFRSR